jgi:hypothetical protein
MLGAGIEPAWDLIPRDFKSLASTGFATRAEKDEPAQSPQAAGARLRADAPYGQVPLAGRATLTPKRNEAGNGTRTRDPNLGKVVLYQLSYSRKQ